MRFRGVHHVEFSVLDYENSVAFYDKMFGWLGYKSFWTLDIGYRSTYYMAFPHSYIGIQPAQSGKKLDHEARATGIHHIALWARNKREVNDFYEKFLLAEGIEVTDAPAAYDVYTPGYYAVFFDDPINGIHWELAHTPLLPNPMEIYRFWKEVRTQKQAHPQWRNGIVKEATRALPPRKPR